MFVGTWADENRKKKNCLILFYCIEVSVWLALSLSLSTSWWRREFWYCCFFFFLKFRFPPKFPEVILPEDLFVSVAMSVRHEINRAFATFRQVASGKDLRKFLMVIYLHLVTSVIFLVDFSWRYTLLQVVAGLWVVSVIGSWFNFLTLFYLGQWPFFPFFKRMTLEQNH